MSLSRRSFLLGSTALAVVPVVAPVRALARGTLGTFGGFTFNAGELSPAMGGGLTIEKLLACKRALDDMPVPDFILIPSSQLDALMRVPTLEELALWEAEGFDEDDE